MDDDWADPAVETPGQAGRSGQAASGPWVEDLATIAELIAGRTAVPDGPSPDPGRDVAGAPCARSGVPDHRFTDHPSALACRACCTSGRPRPSPMPRLSRSGPRTARADARDRHRFRRAPPGVHAVRLGPAEHPPVPPRSASPEYRVTPPARSVLDAALDLRRLFGRRRSLRSQCAGPARDRRTARHGVDDRPVRRVPTASASDRRPQCGYTGGVRSAALPAAASCRRADARVQRTRRDRTRHAVRRCAVAGPVGRGVETDGRDVSPRSEGVAGRPAATERDPEHRHRAAAHPRPPPVDRARRSSSRRSGRSSASRPETA